MMIVELHRIYRPSGGFDNFDCPGTLWDALRKLGESYGWVPSGTLPSPSNSQEKSEAEERHLAELRAIVPPNWEGLAMEAQKREGSNLGEAYELRRKFMQLDLYLPRDWGSVIRMVTTEDAAHWAEALERGLQHLEALDIDLKREGAIIISESVSPELHTLMNEGLKRPFIQAFIDYLRGGAFGFAWDD